MPYNFYLLIICFSRSSSASRRLRTPSPSNSTLVPASGAWSSSLGGRFDPTAYREQQLQRRQVASSNRERAWGAGVGSKNTRTESGYASANSQVSFNLYWIRLLY